MILAETFEGKSVTDHTVEIVERKGKGHPDCICDSIMEAVSVALSQEYIREFGAVLHHNIDKGLLAAGDVNTAFGSGSVIRPMELTIGDRATFEFAGRKVPVAEIAIGTAKKWIRDNMRFVDPEKHLKYRNVLSHSSPELTDIFTRTGDVRPANDTSAAVGYYPLSPTEDAVLALEKYLNSEEFKNEHAETGEDIKVMGLRVREKLDITVAMPFLAGYIRSEKEYFEKKDIVYGEIKRFLQEHREMAEFNLYFNTLDNPGRGLGGVYLSLLGTSAEDADSGQVGRGNRVNGLISVNRPMGTEAAAGKNPVSHVGKIYNILSHKIAKRIYEHIEGIREVYVLLLSRIGAPVDSPLIASAQLLLEDGAGMDEAGKEAEMIIERELSGISSFCMELSRGEYPVC